MRDQSSRADRPSGAGLRRRVGGWLVASDPGLLRLQMAGRTTLTLAVALGVLYLLTKATGQPVTVALLGVVIALLSAMAVNDPDPRQERITMALLPVPAAAAVSIGALLATHLVAGDVVFVVIIFAAVYARRFGSRGMALGMVAFMTYFFALFLKATVGQLPWLIGAVLVGTACSFLMRTYAFPDRPERILHRTLRALWARIGSVVDATADVVQAGQPDERQRRRVRARIARLNQTALMVENQLEGKVDAAMLWPGVDDGELMLRLFDSELAAERVAATGLRAAAAGHEIRSDARTELVGALRTLRDALRAGAPADALEHADRLAKRSTGHGAESDQLVLAIEEMAATATRTRELVEQAASEPPAAPSGPSSTDKSADEEPNPADEEPQTETWLGRLRPTTRQAVQVAIAASLAIVAGELLSPARWYWAVIATFVIFTGTTSRGETLSKGWQRLLGTILGVPAGVLVATAVSGNKPWSVVLIFVCMFSGFYLVKVAYSLMIFWITTMLALLYGLLGQFSVGVLLLRLEETAVGAVIGVVVAMVVLPTSTRATITDGARTFLETLGGLIETATEALLGDNDAARVLTERARQLDQQLQELHTSAKPLTTGIVGAAGSGRTRHTVRVLAACDHYARTLARACDQSPAAPVNPALGSMVTTATEQARANLDLLAGLLDDREPVTVRSATGLLDDAEKALDRQSMPSQRPDNEDRRLRVALRSLRQIDQAVVDLARLLGATIADERTPTATQT